MDEGVGRKDDFVGAGPDFEPKASILIRGTGSGEEFDLVFFEEFAIVDG